jgi:hypothetical protein
MANSKRIVKKRLNELIDSRGEYQSTVPAWLGATPTVIETGKPGLLYARLASGQVVVVLNSMAPAIFDYPVVIAKRKRQKIWEVISVRQPFAITLGSMISSHHTQHEYPNPDTVWVRDSQFLPFLVLPNGYGITFHGGIIKQTDIHYSVDNQEIDLSAYQPAAGALWVLIEIIAGIVTVTLSAEVDGKELLSLSLVPAGTGYEVCAIRLYAGQTEITRDETPNNDIVDLRWGQGRAISNLDDLVDVDVPSPSDNDVLMYDLEADLWISADVSNLHGGHHEHAVTRWNATAGEDTFELPDIALFLEGVTINGLTEDMAVYELSATGTQVILDDVLPMDAIVTANYVLAAME